MTSIAVTVDSFFEIPKLVFQKGAECFIGRFYFDSRTYSSMEIPSLINRRHKDVNEIKFHGKIFRANKQVLLCFSHLFPLLLKNGNEKIL